MHFGHRASATPERNRSVLKSRKECASVSPTLVDLHEKLEGTLVCSTGFCNKSEINTDFAMGCCIICASRHQDVTLKPPNCM